MTILRSLSALVAGLLFGIGLALSGMLDPARVRGFLDIAGNWDPTLAFVLCGAVIVATIGYRLALLAGRPLLDERLHLPTKTAIDGPLIVGSAIFGIGWGMAGFCPGPAVAALPLVWKPAAVFVAAMLAGMLIHDRFVARG